MHKHLKYLAALALGIFHFSLFIEMDYYFIKSFFYMIRNNLY